MNRTELLNDLIGKPWEANAKGPDAYDCWHLCAHVRLKLFAHTLPHVDVPESPSWHWLINTFETHPERKNWKHVPVDKMGLVTATDGAIVLMARLDRPAHAGIWLFPERRVLHADPRHGVMFEPLASLRMGGWTRLLFYEPKDHPTE